MHLQERTETSLITESDETDHIPELDQAVRAVNSCNSWFENYNPNRRNTICTCTWSPRHMLYSLKTRFQSPRRQRKSENGHDTPIYVHIDLNSSRVVYFKSVNLHAFLYPFYLFIQLCITLCFHGRKALQK